MNLSYLLAAALFSALATSASGQLPQDDPIEELSFPHIVILGATGVGKSSLANVFIGEDPTCEDCTFPVCSGADSCTKDTTYAVRPWLGLGQNITVVDTPGFGDTDKEDSVLIDEMMGVLKNTVKSASVLLLVLDGNQDRFSESLQQMLREMRALFGDNMWNNVLVGISKWPFDEASMNQRNKTCIMTPKQCRDEATFSASMMNAIEEKFHVGRNLTFAFIDSWAKHPMNLGDQVQQEAFNRETAILWNFALTVEEFVFKSIQDVLEEYNELKLENAYLRGVLETNITQILQVQQEFAEELTNLEIHQGHTSDLVSQLQVFTTELDNKATSNSERISGLDTTVQDHGRAIQETAINVASNAGSILMLDADIKSLNTTMSLLEKLPLGTIIAWHEIDLDSHPKNWVECDGREILAGPWQGRTTPDINNSKRFLRGGNAAEALEIEEDAFQEHHHQHYHNYFQTDHAMWGNDHGDRNGDPHFLRYGEYTGSTGDAIHGMIVSSDQQTPARTASETRPKNIKVVFLMKCWH